MTRKPSLPWIGSRFGRQARLFVLASFLTFISQAGFLLFFNLYVLDAGFDIGFLGLLNALPSAAALLLSLPLGVLSDRMGGRRAMLLGLLVATAAMGAEVMIPDPGLMVVMAVLQGAGNTFYMVSLAPVMMHLSEPGDRSHLFSLNSAATIFGGIAGNFLAGQLPGLLGLATDDGSSALLVHRFALVATVLVGGLGILPLLLMRDLPRDTAPTADPLRIGGLRTVLSPTLRRLSAPNLMIGIGGAILIPYLNLFFKDGFGVDDSTLGALFSLSSLITGVSQLAAPLTAGRLGGRIRAVIATQGLSLVFLLVLGFSHWLPLSAVAFLLRAALMNMSVPLYAAFCMEQIPEHRRGAANAVLTLSWQLGWAFGPYLSGLVQQAWGFTPLFLATAVLYGLAVALTRLFFGDAEGRSVADAAG